MAGLRARRASAASAPTSRAARSLAPRVLVLNAGSSTLKASVVEPAVEQSASPPKPLAAETIAWGADASRASGRRDDLRAFLGRLEAAGIPVASLSAVGHRVVHGGERFTRPVVIDDAVLAELDGLGHLAPLHNPVALDTIRLARELLSGIPSGIPHVACFDTAFHVSLPEEAVRYPLPDPWRDRWGVRRFGFHGLSVEWAVGRSAVLLGVPVRRLNIVVAHLGSGCSVTAVAGGRSVATSMGMTPLEGLMMGTRAGSIDPGIIVGLVRDGRLSLDEMAEALDHGAGLLAVGGSADMRALLRAEADGDERAGRAIRMFVSRAAAGIAGAATALPGLDVLAFTGGIGEGSGAVRSRIVRRLAVLGFGRLTPRDVARDTVLTPAEARPAVLRVGSREDLVIAAAAASLEAGRLVARQDGARR